MISIIVAHDRNKLIGSNGDMPWGKSIKSDLNWFKQHTINKTVVMGSKTSESIGGQLPNRTNVIMTRDLSKNDQLNSIGYAVNSFEEIQDEWIKENAELFIIGGKTVYEQFLPLADRLYITYIDAEFEGDTYFPDYDLSQYEVIFELKSFDNFPLMFNIFERKKKY